MSSLSPIYRTRFTRALSWLLVTLQTSSCTAAWPVSEQNNPIARSHYGVVSNLSKHIKIHYKEWAECKLLAEQPSKKRKHVGNEGHSATGVAAASTASASTASVSAPLFEHSTTKSVSTIPTTRQTLGALESTARSSLEFYPTDL